MKKKMRQAVPAILSVAMAVTSVPAAAFAAPAITFLSEGESDTQMVSDPETVYVNSFSSSERTQNFNDNWRFYLGEAEGAEGVNFDDSSWRSLDLPHDYSIEQEFSSNMEAESGYLPGGTGWYRKNFTIPADAKGKQVRIDFDGIYMNASIYINGQKLGTHPYGYTPFSFDLTPYLNYGGNNVIAVKVEHRTPSSRWYSGSGIYRDVQLSVMPAVHEALNGTKIELPTLEEKHSGQADVHVRTEVQNDSQKDETVTVSYKIYKKGDESKTPIGTYKTEPVLVPAGTVYTAESDMKASSPELWSIDNPALYVMETEIITDSGEKDTTTSDFGFRYFDFDSSKGFSLNGEYIKLKGVCMHHDQGSLGSEASHRAMERQIEIMKEMGCNAIRVTHNPAAKEFINICNEKGILVIEELFDGWGNKNSNNEDYGKWINVTIEGDNQILGKEDSMKWGEFDLKTLIRRDYNDPCVISWSLGNEVLQGGVSGGGGFANKASELIAWAKEADDTRPVTTGDDNLKNKNNNTVEIAKRLSAAGGLVGYNYTTMEPRGRGKSYDEYHEEYPDWKIYGSETASSVNSRGVYNPDRDIYDYQLTAYDESRVNWGHLASEAWYDTIRKDYVAGEFVWTGFDYIGEPTLWNGVGSGPATDTVWPKSPKNSYFGIVDTAGFPKDSYYLYQSLWNDEVDTVHILPAWNEDVVQKDKSGNVKVVVYSDAANVELVLQPADGGEEISYGKKSMTEVESQGDNGEGGMYTYLMYQGAGADSTEHKNLYRTWNIPYQDGTLIARATDEAGRPITDAQGRSQVTTAGEAHSLDMTADRDVITADGDDLCYITVDIKDENGTIVPDALDRVTFQVEGDGELVGVDNGWTTDHDSYQADNRRAFNGKVLAIVKSTKKAGSFTVTATAEGLESDSVTVTTEPAEGADSGEGNKVEKYEISKNYYVKTGNEPVLPEEISVTYTDGTTAELPVEWNEIPEDKLDKEGSFSVSGDMDGTVVSVNINMINQIAAILNYSTTTPVGEEPVLVPSRPIVAEDGTVLNTSLPVTWKLDEVPEGSFDKAGIVEIEGTAKVFGEEKTVTASVRVQEKQISITDNVAPQARLEESIPDSQTTDTLSAIVDGKTESSNQMSGGRNLTRWSDWKYIKENGNGAESSIKFTYDTQEVLGRATIYFASDGKDLKYPQPGDIKWLYTNDNEHWDELAVKETIGEEIKGTECSVKPYTYEFAPTGGICFELNIKNSTGGPGIVSTGISEVQLNRAEGKFVANSTTELAALTLNGVEAPASALKEGVYNTPMSIVDTLEVQAADNAAATVLPLYEKQVKILIESEDHSARETFVINMESEFTGEPDDPSLDYPTDDLTVTVSSEEDLEDGGKENGAKENAVDNDTSTYWHSNWSGAGNSGSLWIAFELKEETEVNAVRYLPRQSGNGNGRVEGYKVEVSSNGQEWNEVGNGTWKADNSWKIAEFEPVKAKYVRLTGTDTYGDSGRSKFMSAAEVRVRQVPESEDISNASVTLDQEIFEADGEGTAFEPEVTVRLENGEELRYGIDYTVKYENNDRPGNASLTVRGIMGYSGTVTKEFKIVSDSVQMITVEGGEITAIAEEEYTAEDKTSAAAETGQKVTVKAGSPEDGEFSHWRTAPENILTEEQKGSGEITFTVPKGSSYLEAVFKNKNGSEKSDAYSVSKDKKWFAYAAAKDMKELLNSQFDSINEEENKAINDGGRLEAVMSIEKSDKDPSRMDLLKRFKKRAEKPDDEEKATASDAKKATGSDAEKAKSSVSRATSSDAEKEPLNPRDILKSDILSPKQAVEEETEFDDQSMGRFWITTDTVRTVTDKDGKKVSEKTLTKEDYSDSIELTAGIPEKHQDMANYQVAEYEIDGDESVVSLLETEAPDEDRYGKDLRFDASVDGIYAVVYTKCFDVTFKDFNGTILPVNGKSSQRIEYGQPAEAPEEPEREGYRFIGWDKDFDEITSNLIVTAEYEELAGEADKAELETLYKKITKEIETGKLDESDYTEDSWEALKEALLQAEEVINNDEAGKDDVEEALKELEASYRDLEKKPDKTNLERKFLQIMEEIDSGTLDEALYTAESWSELKDALRTAETVLYDSEADADEVEEALKELERAYKALELKPEEPEEPDVPAQPQKPSRPGHGGGGGSSSSGGGYYYESQHRLEEITDEAVPLAGGIYVTEGTWQTSEHGWTFTSAAGEKAVSKWIYTAWNGSYDWYYFGADGCMATGWVETDGNTFYLNPVSDGSRGKMVTGWKQIDGKWYYFNPVSDGTRGAMYKSRMTPDGYMTGADGAWIR